MGLGKMLRRAFVVVGQRWRLSLAQATIRVVDWVAPPAQLAWAGNGRLEDEDSGASPDADDEGHLWFAAPKKRTSHARKRIRIKDNLKYKMKPITNWKACEDCGKPRLLHKLWQCVLPHPACAATARTRLCCCV